jgi:NAD(P)-dependent dehydrogenase (short-subunit alcohol dehydrogenase family)
MPTALITGANRGIGLAFCKELSAQGWEVIALCRKKSKELASLPVQIEEGADVTSLPSLARIKKKLHGKIDLLINNAGILKTDSLKKPNFRFMEEQFAVNVVGVYKVTKTFLPLLKKGSKIAMISSRAGSIAYRKKMAEPPIAMYGYRVSKAALNMLSICLMTDLKPKRIAVGIFFPGLVKTKLVGFYGDIKPQESVRGMLKILPKLNLKTSGTFWSYTGEILPW